jgi:hypothetical protein
VRFWDVTSGEEKQALHGIPAPVLALAFAPSGKRLAAGLLHNQPVVVGKNGAFEQPADRGAVVLCELGKGKPKTRSERKLN